MRQRLQGAKRSLRQEALTPSGRIQGKAPRTTSDPEQGSWRRTCNHNMGQGRSLERAKDNRRLSASARTPRKHTCRTGREEKPQTEVRSPTIRRKGAAPTTRGGRAQPTPDPYGDLIPKGRDNMKKQSKEKGKTHETLVPIKDKRASTSQGCPH